MRVFVVDDSKTMRNIVKSLVETMGATAIEEACDGQDALSRVDAFNPDLILLDWNMPVMDGLAFARPTAPADARRPSSW
jgi:CheY-like chemotaxis protein